MNKIFFLLMLLSSSLFAQGKILVLGDNISAGYGIDINQRWVTLLQQRIDDEKYDYRVINLSITGDSTNGGLLRLPPAIRQYGPQIIIIALGENDGLRRYPLNAIKNNLIGMIKLANLASSKPLLLGVSLPSTQDSTYAQKFQNMFIEIAKEQPTLTVLPNMLINIADNPQLMQADGIYPNESAQITILNNVWPSLKTLLQ